MYKLKSKWFVYLAFCIPFLFLTGCFSTKFVGSVDSICISQAKKKKRYILLPGNTGCKVSDLQYQEFAGFAEKALHKAGYEQVYDLKSAEIAILLTYGISDPQTYNYTYSVPVFGETGISSSSTHGNVSVYSNCASYSQQTTYKPSYGVIGATTHVGTKIYYIRYLALTGFDIEKFKKTEKIEDAPELWSTKVHCLGKTGDLRKVFPYLITAAQEHIGKDTGQKIEFSLSENDKNVRSLLAAKDHKNS
ncbi:MAG: hypothetical protein P0S96_07300 [Simkaniaceae bacterium]|nr:hypothetical protein [Candidatus Sacchlamyda saccharinae]